MLTLAEPAWLLLLPLPPLLWLAARKRPGGGEAPALLHPRAALLASLQARRGGRSLPWLWLAATAALLLALARPQWLEESHQSRAFMIAIDVSGSMRAQDFTDEKGRPQSRLERVKVVIDRFMERRPGDRFGLIVFADDAFTLAPLTSDRRLVRRFLDDVKNGMAGERTALGDAIALAVRRLQSQPPANRALLLLTDGTQSAGAVSAETALAIARIGAVRVYAVGIGSEGKVLFPRGPRERPDFKEVPLDEAFLKRLAADSGGRYYRADDSDALERIVADVERLESPVERPGPTRRIDLFALPLALAGVLATLSLWRGWREVAP